MPRVPLSVQYLLSTFYSLMYLPTSLLTSWLKLVIVEHLRWRTLASPNSVIAFGPAHAVLFIKNHPVGCRNCWSHCSPPHSPDCLPSQGGVQVYLSICWYVTHVCSTSVKTCLWTISYLFFTCPVNSNCWTFLYWSELSEIHYEDLAESCSELWTTQSPYKCWFTDVGCMSVSYQCGRLHM